MPPMTFLPRKGIWINFSCLVVAEDVVVEAAVKARREEEFRSLQNEWTGCIGGAPVECSRSVGGGALFAVKVDVGQVGIFNEG